MEEKNKKEPVDFLRLENLVMNALKTVYDPEFLLIYTN